MKSPVYLNALRAFEASARHQSFSAAAAELSVTPAAIGQLVRGLEEWLGTPLFLRQAKGRARLVPTEVAERALPDIRAGLDRLASGLLRLREGSANGILTITTSPAFAAKWLLPRVERFQERWPDTDVRMDTNLKPLDLATHGIDIGVRYGAGKWPDVTSEKLMDEQIYPVCSPAYARSKRIRKPTDLARVTLIHDLSVPSDAGFASWRAWLRAAGVQHVDTKRGMQINNSAAVLQAAIDGHGVALGRSVMAQDDLRSGRLVRLFPEIDFDSALAYYVVYRPACASSPRLVAFRDWLFEEATGAPHS